MGDSTCLVRGFGYPSVIPIPNESKQGNLMLALGDSVSFGRFLNESLSWEKRSTFLHKNYVEEAERYSRPGSVAQKKAFFEAHYKRIATKKAASADVLEEESAVITEPGEVRENDANDEQRVVLDFHVEICDVKMRSVESRDQKQDGVEGSNECSSIAVGETVVISENLVSEERSAGKNWENVVIPQNEAEERTVEKSRGNDVIPGNKVLELEERPVGKSHGDAVIIGNEAFKERRPVETSPMKLHKFENQVAVKNPLKLNNHGSQVAVSVSSEGHKTPEKERSSLKQDSASSADISSAIGKNRPNLSSSATSTHHKTCNDPSTPAKQVSPLEKEINATLGATISSTCAKGSPSKSFNALMKTSDKEPVRERVFATMETENLGHAQSSTMALVPSEKSPSKSSSALMKTPVEEPERELISTTMKTENLGLACSSVVSTAPLKTPVVAQSNSVSTNPAKATSQSGSIRMNTPSVSSGLGSKSTNYKWPFISSVFSKSYASQSSAESSSSKLSTGKSASKSRQKPEENLNASESRKTQIRKSLKEKAGNKVRKLGCIFCMKDSNLLDEVATPENWGTISMLPPPPPPTNLNKNSSKNNSPKIAKLRTKSFAEKIACENTPPNIQQ